MKKSICLGLIFLVFTGCNVGQKQETSTGERDSMVLESQTNTSKRNSVLDINEELIFEEYLPILMFHYIEDVPSDSPDQLRYGLSFAPESLEQFLIYFKENKIETLTFWDLKEIIEGKKNFPEKAVILTFDDGYISHYENAYKLLDQYGMKGVFYIISDKPDNDPNYARWEQILEMSKNGQEIASHTVSHPNLVGLSEENIKYELQKSKEIIEAKIGKPVISLCYPAGKYDDRVVEIAKENYLFARTTEPGEYFSLNERYTMPTVRIFPTTGIASLEAWFSQD